MAEPVLPPSVGTLGRDSRTDSQADAFAGLAQDLHEGKTPKRPSKESSTQR
jgi:hypothetical protein